MARKTATKIDANLISKIAAETGMTEAQVREFQEKLAEANAKLAEENAAEKAKAEAERKAQEAIDRAELERVAHALVGMPTHVPEAITKFSITTVSVKDKDGKVIGEKPTSVRLYFTKNDFSMNTKALIKTGDDRTEEDIATQIEGAKKLLMDMVLRTVA